MKKEAFVHKSLKCIDEIELALLIPIANKISTYSHIDRKIGAWISNLAETPALNCSENEGR